MSDKVIKDAVALQDTAAVGRGLDASSNLRKLLCSLEDGDFVGLSSQRDGRSESSKPCAANDDMEGHFAGRFFCQAWWPFFPLLLSDMICLSAVENATVAIEVVYFDVQLNQHPKGGK